MCFGTLGFRDTLYLICFDYSQHTVVAIVWVNSTVTLHNFTHTSIAKSRLVYMAAIFTLKMSTPI